ncbi:hypothetical protein [Phyllobacterium zundukense]|uniref:Uncharacterized protein n=1 Tax=Phyllobacterium zundukense TaxID=1867719 RepID=A0A2N9VT22_9HYPH|nr:hypothetical protein [Phyllobacterium zundukense]ATU95446.1 hypothetical protein BLM14_27575 [Phyllobacterium zundukense]PIO42640.1 hypothetical protein B5P45_21990 [Phyllobacterium zundukense]
MACAHIKPIRRKIPFSQGKALVHQIFDDAEVARPFVKCLPAHHRTLGFATQEHEIFLQDTTWDDTVIQCAAELLLGRADTQTVGDADSVGQEQLENYLYLATCYTVMNRGAALEAYALELSAIAGLVVRPRLTISPTRSSWAELKPGDSLYETAIGTGCRLYRRYGEPQPLRDA